MSIHWNPSNWATMQISTAGKSFSERITMITPLRTRVRWMRNLYRRRGYNKILIVDNRTYCLNCLQETDCKMYCDNKCRDQYHNWKRRTTPKLPPSPPVSIISAAQVRREEGLANYVE